MIFKKDNFIFGLALGLIAPLIGFMLYKLIKFKSLSFRKCSVDETQSQFNYCIYKCFIDGQCHFIYNIYQWLSG